MPPRKNQTYSHQQNIWVVSNYGEFKSPTTLRWKFRKHFKFWLRQLPHSYAFSRVIIRFMVSGDVSPSKLPGLSRTKFIEENIDTVGNLVEEKPYSSISEVSTAINLSTSTVWKILRKILRKYPYKPKTVQSLADKHKLCRVQFFNWRGTYLSTNLIPSRKNWIVYFYFGYFFLKWPTLGKTNNIIITI